MPKDEWVDESMQEKEVNILYSDDDEEKWNELEIFADGNKIQAWLNGDMITNFKGKEILNNEVHKQYDVGKKGFIGLAVTHR